MSSSHPTIAAFEAGAELLDLQGRSAGLDGAIVQLASWMDLASDHLSDDDRTVLIGIGAAMYREGLQHRYHKG